MPTKVVLLTGSIAAGSAWTEVTRVTVPAGETWTVQEVRVVTSHDDVGVRIITRIGASVDTVANTTGKVSNAFKLPLPLSFSVPAAGIIALECNNPTTSAQTVHVELVYSVGT